MTTSKLAQKTRQYIAPILENKTIVAVYALCLILVLSNIYVYLQKVQIYKSISNLQFELDRLKKYIKQKRQIERKLSQIKTQLNNITNKWLTAQSDALIFAKVQTLLDEICKKYNLTLSNTSISTTTTIYDHIKKTKITFRVKGSTPNVIKFIEDFEQIAKSFGIYIQEASVYIERYHKRQENVILCAYFKISVIWREGAKS